MQTFPQISDQYLGSKHLQNTIQIFSQIFVQYLRHVCRKLGKYFLRCWNRGHFHVWETFVRSSASNVCEQANICEKYFTDICQIKNFWGGVTIQGQSSCLCWVYQDVQLPSRRERVDPSTNYPLPFMGTLTPYLVERVKMCSCKERGRKLTLQ